jgi:hypothetical protein
MDDAFGHWLAGFIDGEGSFNIDRNGPRFCCMFRLVVRADDEAVIREIADRAGFGQVYYRRRQKAASENEHGAIGWQVRTKADCHALVELLDRFPLRAKKARDYDVWRAAVAEWATIRYPRARMAQDWSRMAALKAALEGGRRYDGEAEVELPPSPQLRLVG